MIFNRIYIIMLLLCVFGACTPETHIAGNGDASTPSIEQITVRGNVCDGAGQPLAGVVVSDCYKCVETDADGRFELDSDLNVTTFVYVSIPSGYTVPMKNGLPIYYKRLSEESKVGECYQLEFVLDKMQASPDRYTVMMVGDPQPRPRNAGFDNIAYHSLDCCNDLYRDMRETGAVIRHSRPCYAIVLGDIVHENMSLFDEYIKEGTSKMGFPTFNVIGNHDHRPAASTDEEGALPFEERFGPTNYSFNLGKIHYVVVDNMIQSLSSEGTLTKTSNGLRDDIAKWLQSDLSFVDNSTTIMICSHAPIFGGTNEAYKKMKNGHVLYSELSRFKKVHSWAGHIHNSDNDSRCELKNVEAHSVTRATGELWTNEYMSLGIPRGYVLVEVDGEEISWKFKPTIYQTGKPVGDTPAYNHRRWDYDENGVAKMKSTGKTLDDTYQMNVYPKGAYGDNYVYANVFMWDEKWEAPVYVSSDGGEYPMTRIKDSKYRFDIGQKELCDFYQRGWNTDFGNTFFRVFMGRDSDSGVVKVKDRFGNEYIQSVSW